jgi:hypothetical protein
MSRSSHPRPARRRRSTLVAGIVLAASALAGATTADATPNATDLEGTVLRIGGAAVTGSNPIPSGRTLTPVRLTTTDPNSSDVDGFLLQAAVPTVRTNRFTVPGSPAEQATFRIDGTVVATSVPDFRSTSLQTDAGPLPAVVFTAGGVTYAIPRAAVGAVTRTVARSTVGTTPITSIVTHQYGLLPVGAVTQVGSAFVQPTQNLAPSGPGVVRSRTLHDADVVRGNADTVAEELLVPGNPAPVYGGREYGSPNEVLATISLRNGTIVQVNAVSYPVSGPYGSGSTSWLFDRAALAAAGATIADVTGVISQAPTDHALTWQDLGFDLA